MMMGFEEKLNKRLIGAVMGSGYIEKPKKSVSEEDDTKKTKKLDPLKDFLELGV
ncbi:MAG: hypothetical protein LBD11_03735 [Candidatus Peribacteria bacterium]|jgi:hypothetical protein|nr:hypothetical protein [Candidatus Peribacteria bacterium]